MVVKEGLMVVVRGKVSQREEGRSKGGGGVR